MQGRGLPPPSGGRKARPYQYRVLQIICHLDPFECLRVNSGRDLLSVLRSKISHDRRNDIIINVLLRHDTRFSMKIESEEC